MFPKKDLLSKDAGPKFNEIAKCLGSELNLHHEEVPLPKKKGMLTKGFGQNPRRKKQSFPGNIQLSLEKGSPPVLN